MSVTSVPFYALLHVRKKVCPSIYHMCVNTLIWVCLAASFPSHEAWTRNENLSLSQGPSCGQTGTFLQAEREVIKPGFPIQTTPGFDFFLSPRVILESKRLCTFFFSNIKGKGNRPLYADDVKPKAMRIVNWHSSILGLTLINIISCCDIDLFFFSLMSETNTRSSSIILCLYTTLCILIPVYIYTTLYPEAVLLWLYPMTPWGTPGGILSNTLTAVYKPVMVEHKLLLLT